MVTSLIEYNFKCLEGKSFCPEGQSFCLEGQSFWENNCLSHFIGLFYSVLI